MSEPNVPQEQEELITLPLKTFLKYFYQHVTYSNFMTGNVGDCPPALAYLLSVVDPKEKYYHIDGDVNGKDNCKVYPIGEWRTSQEKRVRQQHLKDLENKAKEKTNEYRLQLIDAVLTHPLFKGLFNASQADMIARQIILKKDLSKAKQFGVEIPEEEMLIL